MPDSQGYQLPDSFYLPWRAPSTASCLRRGAPGRDADPGCGLPAA